MYLHSLAEINQNRDGIDSSGLEMIRSWNSQKVLKKKNIKIVLLKVVNEENAWNDLENPC